MHQASRTRMILAHSACLRTATATRYVVCLPPSRSDKQHTSIASTPLGCYQFQPVADIGTPFCSPMTSQIGYPHPTGKDCLDGTDCTVRVFRQQFTLEDAIGSHTCSLEALAGVCGKLHSSRVFTPLIGWHCKSHPNTEGTDCNNCGKCLPPLHHGFCHYVTAHY
jgi:hypothetical protein